MGRQMVCETSDYEHFSKYKTGARGQWGRGISCSCPKLPVQGGIEKTLAGFGPGNGSQLWFATVPDFRGMNIQTALAIRPALAIGDFVVDRFRDCLSPPGIMLRLGPILSLSGWTRI